MIRQEEIVYKIDIKRTSAYKLQRFAEPFVLGKKMLVFSEEGENKYCTCKARNHISRIFQPWRMINWREYRQYKKDKRKNCNDQIIVCEWYEFCEILSDDCAEPEKNEVPYFYKAEES